MNDNTVPRLYYKCISNELYDDTVAFWTVGKLYPVDTGSVYSKSPAHWWTPGKLYSVEDDGIRDDEGDFHELKQLAWYPQKFKLLWLLPDGTELEALE